MASRTRVHDKKFTLLKKAQELANLSPGQCDVEAAPDSGLLDQVGRESPAPALDVAPRTMPCPSRHLGYSLPANVKAVEVLQHLDCGT